MAQNKNLSANEEQELRNPGTEREETQKMPGRTQETPGKDGNKEEDQKIWGTGSDGGSAADGGAA